MSGVSKVNKKSNLEKLLKYSLNENLGLDEAGGGAGGKDYENIIFNSILAAGASGLYLTPAGNDSHRADADMFLPIGNGRYVGPINVEAKMNQTAQLGGTSFSVAGNQTNPKIDAVTEVEGMDSTILAQIKGIISTWLSAKGGGAIIKLKNALNKYHAAQFKNNPELVENLKISNEYFPMNASVEAWQKIGKGGKSYDDPVYGNPGQGLDLLKPLNKNLEANINVFTSYYNKKNVHYLQIGDLLDSKNEIKNAGGLYILGDSDPYGLAALGIPKINPELLQKNKIIYRLEIRPGAGGSKTGAGGHKFRGIGIRVQGRLQFSGGSSLPKSPHRIDTVQGVKNLMKAFLQHYSKDASKFDKEQIWNSAKIKQQREERAKAVNVKTRKIREATNIKNLISFLLEQDDPGYEKEETIKADVEKIVVQQAENADDFVFMPELQPDSEILSADKPDEISEPTNPETSFGEDDTQVRS